MGHLKARLQKARDEAELGKHDRRVLSHLEQQDTLEVGGIGGVATPVSLALLDLAEELDKLKAEYEVVVGDWNVRHPGGKQHASAAGRRNTAVVQRFAMDRGLVDPLKEGHLDVGKVEPRTYFGGGPDGKNESWIDYYLVSKCLVGAWCRQQGCWLRL